MSRISKFSLCFITLALLSFLFVKPVSAYSNETLKNGTRGDTVSKLQADLKKLGYMSIGPTGYYGDITEAAVKKFQKKYALTQDGIAGIQTLGKIDKLMGRDTVASRGEQKSKRQSVVDYARKFLGIKYVWGGTTKKGFDCSGFVKYVYKNFGINLNRVSSGQAKNGVYIKKASLLLGDLVFFDTNGGKNGINHVGIYIGGGKFIHASSSHKKIVTSNINKGFYSKVYMTARRVLK